MVEDQEDSLLDDGQHAVPLGSNADTDVKVVVRVRPPLLGTELQPAARTCLEVDGYDSLLVTSGSDTTSMQFNWVAGPATTQSDFFKVVGKPTVENCLSGFNSSVFAYGQTGSGKTYTMVGELPQGDVLPADAGLIPRIFQYLWRRMPEVQASMLSHCAASMAASEAEHDSSIKSSEPSLTWLVRCSMLEIHREDIIDLLRPGNGPLTLREDIRKGVYVEGLCETVVENVQDALAVLRQGIAARQVAATDYNAASSRSHCIFTCHVESRLEPRPGLVNVRSSRLHLVDLAGSERLKYGAGGMGAGENSDRLLKETTSINRSLTVLGMVILKLTEQQPHIPYRNSKLTFLLQDSIGGNAKTVIVANVSPSEVSVQETISTLGFASRARKLVNKAIINEDTSGDAAVLRSENKRLKQELALARQILQHGAVHPLGQTAAELAEQQEQLQQALVMLAELGDRNSELEEALEYSKRERIELERGCLEVKQELAAVQVTLQQTIRENRTWRHRWFKMDKPGRSLTSSRAPSETGCEEQPADLVGVTLQGAAGSQASQERAGQDATAEETGPVLQYLNCRLSELVKTLCPGPDGASSSPAAETASVALSHKVRQSLIDLAAACKPKASEVPEFGSIVDTLELLAAWQHYHHMAAEQQGAGLASLAATDDKEEASEQAVSRATVSGIPRTSFTPFELHRQLREERMLTAKLSEQVRQLQQKLVLAAETAGSAAGKNILAMSTDSTLRGSCMNTLQASSDAADIAAAYERQQQKPVVVQLSIAESTDASAAAEARITDLQQQVAALQEQLEVVSRERAGLQGRLASARTVLAAARCSTPSSLNSSRIPSPQPCFSPLRSLIGESIDEGDEEELEGLPPPDSWRHRHKAPGSPSSPVQHLSTPTSSHNSQELAPENSLALADEDSEVALSPQTHWNREHSRFQQHEQQLEQRRKLARAVHAAIKQASQPGSCSSPDAQSVSPVSFTLPQHDICSPSLGLFAGEQQEPAEVPHSPAMADMELLREQLQAAGCETQKVLLQSPAESLRSSLGGLKAFLSSYRKRQKRRQQQEDCQDEQTASGLEAGVACVAVSAANELHCDGVGLLMLGSSAAPAASVASRLEMLRAWPMQQQITPVSAPGSVHSNTGSAVLAQDACVGCSRDQTAAVSVAAATSAVAVAGADDGEEASSTLRYQPASGPAWQMADYEEEFRQLSQQLQELLSNNSSLKATLQQRERALADKDAQLDQQSHDLECCEQMVQELRDRLAASEAAAAAAAAEHCDAMWAKGQVSGLLELNEQLQEQLMAQGEELETLKAALERFMTSEAAPHDAAAYKAAACQYPIWEDVDNSKEGQYIPTPAADAPEAPDTLMQQQAAELCAATADSLIQLESYTDQQQLLQEGQPKVETSSLAAVAACVVAASPAVQIEAEVQRLVSTAVLADHAQDTASTQAASGPAAPAAAETPRATLPIPEPDSPATTVYKQLCLQSSQLSAQPANLQVAAEQAILLRHQLETVGLQVQQRQLEARLAHVKLQMDRLQQHQQVQLQQQQLQLQLYQQQNEQLWRGQYDCVLGQVHDDAVANNGSQCQQPDAVTNPIFCASPDSSQSALVATLHLTSSRDHSSTAFQHAQQPCHSNRPSRRRSCHGMASADDLSSLGDLGTDVNITNTSQDDDCHLRCSSRCSDNSDDSSPGQCMGMLSELVNQLNALAQVSHEASTFRAASASTLLPQPGQEHSWPTTAAAAELQSRLQVSSVYELEAARGLVHASAAALELQTVLGTAERKAKSAYRQRMRSQIDTTRESPVAQALLSKFESVQPHVPGVNAAVTEQDGSSCVEQQQPPIVQEMAGVAQPELHEMHQHVQQAAASKFAPSETSALPQHPVQEQQQLVTHDWQQLLRRLEEQQQHILQSLTAVSNSQSASALSAAVVRQKELLDQLTDARILVPQDTAALPELQQEVSWQSADSAAHHHKAADQQQKNQQLSPAAPEQPSRWKSSSSQEPFYDSAAGASGMLPDSISPSKRQLRNKQREVGRQSLEAGSTSAAAYAARDRSDQQQLRDSFKGERIQQLLQSSKTGSLLEAVTKGEDTCDAGCQTNEGPAVSCPASTAASDVSSCQAEQLQVDMSVQVGTADLQTADENPELLQLRGEVVKLQLQVQQLKTRAQVAEDVRRRGVLGLPRSYSSCSSRGELDMQWCSEGVDLGIGSAGDATGTLLGGNAELNQQSGIPAGLLLSPGTAAVAGSRVESRCASPSSTTSKVSGSHSTLLLTSRVRELQAQCMYQANTIQQLENQVRQQDMQLKQAACGVAGGGSGSSRGCNTPRGLSMCLSPRPSAAAVFSPRVSTTTPSRAFITRDAGGGDAIATYPALPVINESSSGCSPTKISRLGSTGSSAADAGWLSARACAVVPERSMLGSKQQLGVSKDAEQLISVSYDGTPEVAAKGSSRRLSLGSIVTKSHRGAPGRLRVAAISKAYHRRQSLG